MAGVPSEGAQRLNAHPNPHHCGQSDQPRVPKTNDAVPGGTPYMMQRWLHESALNQPFNILRDAREPAKDDKCNHTQKARPDA